MENGTSLSGCHHCRVDRRWFLRTGCAACAGVVGVSSLPLGHRPLVDEPAVRVRIVYALHAEQQAVPDWPNIGFDSRPVMDGITRVLNEACPDFEFAVSMAKDADEMDLRRRVKRATAKEVTTAQARAKKAKEAARDAKARHLDSVRLLGVIEREFRRRVKAVMPTYLAKGVDEFYSREEQTQQHVESALPVARPEHPEAARAQKGHQLPGLGCLGIDQ